MTAVVISLSRAVLIAVYSVCQGYQAIHSLCACVRFRRLWPKARFLLLSRPVPPALSYICSTNVADERGVEKTASASSRLVRSAVVLVKTIRVIWVGLVLSVISDTTHVRVHAACIPSPIDAHAPPKQNLRFQDPRYKPVPCCPLCLLSMTIVVGPQRAHRVLLCNVLLLL